MKVEVECKDEEEGLERLKRIRPISSYVVKGLRLGARRSEDVLELNRRLQEDDNFQDSTLRRRPIGDVRRSLR
jgi:Golgi nucleoside diphosphatase